MIAWLSRVGKLHPALRDPRIGKALTLAFLYATWLGLYRILTVSFVTYFVFTTDTAARPRLEDVTESLTSNELWIAALGALAFVVILRFVTPRPDLPAPAARFRVSSPIARGAIQGLILAVGIAGASLAGGIYRYLGFFVHFEQALLAAGNVLLRAASLGIMVFAEEYLFRGKILPLLLSPSRRPGLERSEKTAWQVAAMFVSALLYSAIKSWQFELGAMQAATLALVALALALRSLHSDGTWSESGWKEGAALWATVLLVFHPLLGLPVLGSDFSGVFLIKYQPWGQPNEFLRLFTGGAGGPLSGFALQILMIFDMIRTGLRYRSHSNPQPSETRDA